MFKLHTSIKDDFDEVGEGGRQDGDIWYRSDLKEIRACLDGKIVTLVKVTGDVVSSAKLVGSRDDIKKSMNVVK